MRSIETGRCVRLPQKLSVMLRLRSAMEAALVAGAAGITRADANIPLPHCNTLMLRSVLGTASAGHKPACSIGDMDRTSASDSRRPSVRVPSAAPLLRGQAGLKHPSLPVSKAGNEDFPLGVKFECWAGQHQTWPLKSCLTESRVSTIRVKTPRIVPIGMCMQLRSAAIRQNVYFSRRLMQRPA
jgi:hypothetical protein